MARKRTIVLINQPSPGAMEPLGTLREVLAQAAGFNAAPDGSGPQGMGVVPGMVILHGPGFILEVPGDGDPKSDVMQIMATVTDEDFAWPVLSRMCKAAAWKMMDPESGRTFG